MRLGGLEEVVWMTPQDILIVQTLSLTPTLHSFRQDAGPLCWGSSEEP